MKKIDAELEILGMRFDKMRKEYQENLLGNQFTFVDFFAQSIYKHELRAGVIDKFPNGYNEIMEVEIAENTLWLETDFYAIIDEWSDEVPMLKFNSLGNYMLFFKSIFFCDYESAIKSVALKDRSSSEYMSIKFKKLIGQDVQIWESLEKYFYLKGIQIIGRKC